MNKGIKFPKILISGAIFVLCFASFALAFSADWLKMNFMGVNIEQILFHLRFPLVSKSTPYIKDFCIEVLLPSVALAIFVIYIRKLWLKLALSIVIFIACIYIVEDKFEITAYLEQSKKVSDFYEKYYMPFDSANLADFTPTQNLIVIFAESMESTFSSKNIPTNFANRAQIGGGEKRLKQKSSNQNHSKFKYSQEIWDNDYSPFGELIPNLTNLALKNTNFSTTDTLGGVNQVAGTNWTIAGITSYLCGIPLNMPIYKNDFTHEYFLDSAICVSDILAQIGYKQAYFSNLDSKFSGMRYLMESHSVEVLDLPYFQSQNIVPNPLPKDMQGYWDIKDAELFKLAKNHLDSLGDSQPFALYISTIDTHSGSIFVDKEHCNEIGADYKGAVLCSDKIISDFVRFVQNSRFGANTTIIILGDHLSMMVFVFPDNAKRFIYNAFINPQFTQKPTIALTKNRKLTHFDITPLILDSLGIRAESFGLGRNPLYGATLLESDFDIDSFNALLAQRNNLYDSFWEVKKR